MSEKVEIMIRPIDTLAQEDTTDIISKYVTPDTKCSCCNVPNFSIKINKAFLDGMSYASIVEKFKVEADTLKVSLNTAVLSNHFTNHFNSNGVAVAEYNRKFGMAKLPIAQQQEMKNIFSVLVNDRVHDLELLDLSMKEQIKRMKELEDIKTERINEKRTFNLDQLIMKQEMIMNNLQSQILTKLKIWQKAQFQSKQLEIMDRQFQFLDHKTASFLGLEGGSIALEPLVAKEAERLYLKVVIENIIKRIRATLDSTLNVSSQDKAQYLKELTRQFKGIDKDINDQFQIQIKQLKNVK